MGTIFIYNGRKLLFMERNRNEYIAGPEPSKRKHGPANDRPGQHKDRKAIRNASVSSPETHKSISHDADTKDRQPTGEWVHPVTNHDEQRRATNTGNDGVMGEKETEGV
jgi:hypothetical protein